MKEFSEFFLCFLLNSNCEFKHVQSRIQSENSSHGNKCEVTGDLYTYTEMGELSFGWGNLSNESGFIRLIKCLNQKLNPSTSVLSCNKNPSSILFSNRMFFKVRVLCLVCNQIVFKLSLLIYASVSRNE